MSVTFRILRARGVVYVRYFGFVGIESSLIAFRDYMEHPDCRPGQKHLVDLSEVTEFEKDYARILQLQALKAEQFVGQPVETMLAYIAPTAAARAMAALVLRSWEGNEYVIPRVLDTEAEALAFLGMPERRVAELLEGTG